MKSKDDMAMVNRIIKLYGPVIDLRANPGVIIEILRRFEDEPPDGGTPCGGVPPGPPPPPSPSMAGERVTNEDLMKVVLKLSRDVNALKKAMPKATAKAATRRR